MEAEMSMHDHIPIVEINITKNRLADYCAHILFT